MLRYFNQIFKVTGYTLILGESSLEFVTIEVTSPHFGPGQSSLPLAPGLEPDSLSGAVR